MNDRVSLLCVRIATGQRVVLLAWEVLPYGSTAADTQLALLQRIQPLLPDPSHVRITLFGDAEFRAVELQRFCQQHHWHWHVGVKSDTLYQAANGVWKTLRSIAIQRGQRRYVPAMILTHQHLSLLGVGHRAESACLAAGPQTVLDCADKNRDLKSAGFDLKCSALPDPARLSHLVLAMAETWLWMVYVGHWVIRTGRDSADGGAQTGL